MLAVLAWGLLLAVGAIGWRLQVTDPRRAVFVVVAVLGYCGLWLLALNRRSSARGQSDTLGWSRSAVVSLVSGIAGWAIWGAAVGMWQADRRLAWILGWLAAFGFGAGTTAALVALSDPLPRRGKWLAGVAILLTGAAVVWFVWRVQSAATLAG
jgi:hypothetical protein